MFSSAALFGFGCEPPGARAPTLLGASYFPARLARFKACRDILDDLGF